MSQHRKAAEHREWDAAGLLILSVLALLTGAGAGLVAAGFRLALARANGARSDLIGWAHGHGALGAVCVVATVAACAAVAASLVRRIAPAAKGSGLPHVEAVLKHKTQPAPLRLIPVKFVGGALAIGGGLALGREGPSIQMGASVGQIIARISRLKDVDAMALIAAGGGAGLAVAFNAPLAGALLVLEEMVKRFETKKTIAVLAASSSAIAVSRLLLGSQPDFRIAPLPYPGSEALPLFIALGLVLGFLGVIYNRLILGMLAIQYYFKRCPVETRAALVGAAVGVAAWFIPRLVGGGEVLAQEVFNGGISLGVLALALLFRFALGPFSYSAQAPGGLFAPLLAVGVIAGLLFGSLCVMGFPRYSPPAMEFAVVGMAAFFCATVRAPVTGIVLATEMTASFTLILPMVAACFGAMLVATLMNDEPIYDALGKVPDEREIL